jgi:hypothetical protein
MGTLVHLALIDYRLWQTNFRFADLRLPPSSDNRLPIVATNISLRITVSPITSVTSANIEIINIYLISIIDSIISTHTYRYIETQTDRKTKKQTGRQAGRRTQTPRDKQASRQTGSGAERQIGRLIARQAGIQARQAGRQTDRQIGRDGQTDEPQDVHVTINTAKVISPSTGFELAFLFYCLMSRILPLRHLNFNRRR